MLSDRWLTRQRGSNAFMRTTCPNCKRTYAVDPTAIGKKGRCKACGYIYRIGDPAKSVLDLVESTYASKASVSQDESAPSAQVDSDSHTTYNTGQDLANRLLMAAGKIQCKSCGDLKPDTDGYKCPKCMNTICRDCLKDKRKSFWHGCKGYCPLCGELCDAQQIVARQEDSIAAKSKAKAYCPVCDSKWAMRLVSAHTSRTGAGWAWNVESTLICPICSNAECYFEGCAERAVTSLGCTFHVGSGGSACTLQDDACLCQTHFDLLCEWRRQMGELTCRLLFFSRKKAEAELAKSIFGCRPARKQQYIVKVIGEAGSVWHNQYFN